MYCLSPLVTLVSRLPDRGAWICLLLCGFPGAQLIAAEQESSPGRPDALVSPESMVQMLIALVVVVAIIIGLSIIVRRLSLLPGASSGMIKILGGLSLNSKDRLLLVQVGEEQILISASPGRVGMVHELQEPVDPEKYRHTSRADSKSFNTILTQVLKK